MALTMEELTLQNLGIAVSRSAEVINRRYKRAIVRPDDPNQWNYCGPLALSIVMRKPYKEVNDELKAIGARKDDTSCTYTGRYLKGPEWEAYYKLALQIYNAKAKKQRTRLTVAAFARNFKKGRFLVIVSGHALAVVDGVVYNTLEKGRGSRIQQIYQYVKK